MHHVRLSRPREQRTAQVIGRADARRAVHHLSRIGPGVRDELSDGLRGMFDADHQRVRRVHHQRDWRVILQRIEGHRLLHVRIDRTGGARREEERVAVRRGFRDVIGTDRARCTAAIVDDHRLTEAALQTRCELGAVRLIQVVLYWQVKGQERYCSVQIPESSHLQQFGDKTNLEARQLQGKQSGW